MNELCVRVSNPSPLLLQNFHDFLGVIFTSNAVDHLAIVGRDARPILFFFHESFAGIIIFDGDA